MTFFHLSSTWLSDIHITNNCVFCWYTVCIVLYSFCTLSVDKNRHFLTPSPPHLVHVVIECPLSMPSDNPQMIKVTARIIKLYLVRFEKAWIVIYQMNTTCLHDQKFSSGRKITVKIWQCQEMHSWTSISLQIWLRHLSIDIFQIEGTDFKTDM